MTRDACASGFSRRRGGLRPARWRRSTCNSCPSARSNSIDEYWTLTARPVLSPKPAPGRPSIRQIAELQQAAAATLVVGLADGARARPRTWRCAFLPRCLRCCCCRLQGSRRGALRQSGRFLVVMCAWFASSFRFWASGQSVLLDLASASSQPAALAAFFAATREPRCGMASHFGRTGFVKRAPLALGVPCGCNSGLCGQSARARDGEVRRTFANWYFAIALSFWSRAAPRVAGRPVHETWTGFS